MPTRQASARASRQRYESTPERGRAGSPGRKKINVCARNSSARSPIRILRAIAIVCSIIRRSKAARIPPQRLVGADRVVRLKGPLDCIKGPRSGGAGVNDMPVACQSRAPECPQAFGAQRLRGLRPSDYCCTSLAPVGAAINNGRSRMAAPVVGFEIKAPSWRPRRGPRTRRDRR